VTSQIFLNRIEQRLHGKHVANVPSAHVHPTSLSPDDVLRHVAATYRVRLGTLLDRSHRDAYQTAVYLLRRAANEPLHTVAVRFQVSPSRISKIQQAIERNPFTPKQLQALTRCNVKN
jgi:chromosomal replication initiation ATPase DnaA